MPKLQSSVTLETKRAPAQSQSATAEPAGYIYNIMRYSLHDGPGIRTTVFFKGCPLRCWWCHNPESQESAPQLVYFADRCLSCGDCIPICPNGAVHWVNGSISMDGACRGCGTCTDSCAADARELLGRWMTVAETLAEIEKDAVFYDESGGGVSFSGGEPLLQPVFLEALLDACRARHIHTVVDTSGLAPREVLLRLSGKVDLFYYDVKLVDAQKHQHYIGVPGDVILENLEALARARAAVVIRFPVIPGVNDGDAEIAALAALLARLNLRRIHLLPYHKIGVEKYRRLNRPYLMQGVEPPSPERLKHIAGWFEGQGFTVRIGG
jgi:pyruvate formate lyase activating enzyme